MSTSILSSTISEILDDPNYNNKRRLFDSVKVILDHQKSTQLILEKKLEKIECSFCKLITKTKRCGKCKTMRYCSIDCQKGDWDNHKEECFVVVN
jgi:hypothetical protein